jgi:DNA-directed RNA polymerase subunit RPC12/RpoP
MARTKKMPPAKADKRYIVCPLCGQKVLYLRRVAHSCFKFHLSEIERNVQQMNRE